jgi:hypothetical protein
LEDALKGVGRVYKFGSSFHKIKIGCKKGIVRKSKQDKKGDMWAISNKEKNTKSWNNYKNKGTEHTLSLVR